MGARDTYRWKVLRQRLVSQATHCAICHRPLNPNAPARSKWSSSVDHVQPLALGGDPFDPANLRVTHYGCNSSRGVGPGQKRRTRAKPRRANWW